MAEYSSKVLAELKKLKKQSFRIAQEQALLELSREFDKWKKKRIGPDTLEVAIEKHKSFRKDMLERFYIEDGDPGVPVAEALIKGYIKKEDLSDEAYNSIEILIDLVNI